MRAEAVVEVWVVSLEPAVHTPVHLAHQGIMQGGSNIVVIIMSKIGSGMEARNRLRRLSSSGNDALETELVIGSRVNELVMKIQAFMIRKCCSAIGHKTKIDAIGEVWVMSLGPAVHAPVHLAREGIMLRTGMMEACNGLHLLSSSGNHALETELVVGSQVVKLAITV